MPTINDGLVGILHGSKSASFRAANAHLLAPAGPCKGSPKDIDKFCGILASPAPKVAVTPQEGAKKRIRQNTVGMNKTEQAFFDLMIGQYGNISVRWQPVTLRLANGVRYTPDVCLFVSSGKLFVYEVKGFMREDAAVKLKVAASLYPWIKFHLVSKRKGGGWDIQEVLS